MMTRFLRMAIPTALLALTAAANASAADTSSIGAEVRDALGQPVAGATVTVTGGHFVLPMTFTTDARGRFIREWLPAGTYSIKVEREGYPAVEFNDSAVQEGELVFVDFTMDPGYPGTKSTGVKRAGC